ncbi:hypothetical protein CTM87_01400 [Photobacterium phosphoreum]|nr:hypothetical protein AYY24_01140 [Photobacterium phosphoreum]PSW38974.1 hypothetical protein CTM87_01400 [Photobacterium phosphoreum]
MVIIEASTLERWCINCFYRCTFKQECIRVKTKKAKGNDRDTALRGSISKIIESVFFEIQKNPAISDRVSLDTNNDQEISA